MSGHTKTPWRTKGNDGKYLSTMGWEASNWDATDASYMPIKAGRKVIALVLQSCSVDSTVRDESEHNANAAFIVRAVNSHDALVEALKEARTTLSITRSNILTEMKRGRDYQWEDVPAILQARIDHMDAALLLAEPPS